MSPVLFRVIMSSVQMRVAVDQWVYFLALSLGVIVLAVSVLGIVGTCTAPRFIARQRCNHWMFFYQLFIIAAVLAILIATITFLSFIKTIEDSRAGNTKFQNNITAWIVTHRNEWLTIERLLNCCGFEYVFFCISPSTLSY